MFKELFERTNPKVYFRGLKTPTLWVSYGEGSGTTLYMVDLHRYLSSDQSDTGHYSSIVSKLSSFVKVTEPIKAKNNVKLFEIPVYPSEKYTQFSLTLDVWGGDVKPQDKYYMMVTEEKSTIINFFKSEKEALSWVKAST